MLTRSQVTSEGANTTLSEPEPAVPTSAPEPALAQTEGFSEVTEEPDAPANWFLQGTNAGSYKLRLSREMVFAGAASAVLIASERADPSRFGSITQAVSAEAFRGKRLELTAQMATEEAHVGSALWVRADDQHGTMVAFENAHARGPRGSQSWTSQRIVIDIPDTAAALLFGAVLRGAGKLYLDQVALRVVDSSVPLTAKPTTNLSGVTNRAPDLERIPPEPLNLGFEIAAQADGAPSPP
ncbi:MAG: hypothetical protein IRZ28_08740 [Steroidobacteraceae bacterium]|nr:hypothetical protein [Steroidobacteraceae bacterium]